MINKATATVTVNGYTGVYDAAAHGATGSATGVAGDFSAAGSSLNLGASFTNVPGGTANWTFTGGTNYNNQNGTAAIVINKANPTIVVTPYSVTYDAAAHTATGSAKGVQGETLTGLDLSATTHTNAGTYPTDPWTFTSATVNYNNKNGTVSDVIGKASTITALASDNNPSCYGSPVKLTATVTPSTVTGSVEFFDGTTSLGTKPLAGGTASLTISTLSAGSHPIKTVYSGDGNYATSTSSVLTQIVNALPIATIVNTNPQLYYGYSLDQSTIIKVTPSGGVGPYKIVITMNRVLGCNAVTSTG